MASSMAFALAATSSSFTQAPLSAKSSLCVVRVRPAAHPSRVSFGGNNNSAIRQPIMAADDPKSDTGAGKGLPVMSLESASRGLNLLREDLLKNAPIKLGVGRQDVGAVMKPLPGEPGYKPEAYETVRVSELGISPFPDDANAVGKVGGVDAVKKAAVDVKVNQKTSTEIKRELLNIKATTEVAVFDVPDYLKPIPEDTPRKGYTWKNYDGQ